VRLLHLTNACLTDGDHATLFVHTGEGRSFAAAKVTAASQNAKLDLQFDIVLGGTAAVEAVDGALDLVMYMEDDVEEKKGAKRPPTGTGTGLTTSNSPEAQRVVVASDAARPEAMGKEPEVQERGEASKPHEANKLEEPGKRSGELAKRKGSKKKAQAEASSEPGTTEQKSKESQTQTSNQAPKMLEASKPEEPAKKTETKAYNPLKPEAAAAEQQAKLKAAEQLAKDIPAFVAAAKFAGARQGMVFKKGPQGVGYYKDSHVSTANGGTKRKAEEPTDAPPAKRQGTLPGGLKYETLRAAGKEGPKAKRGRTVQVRYEGRLASNGKRFDKGVIGFRLGAGEVIKGWDIGVDGMQVGERRRLLIPSQLAYGQRGAPPDIPRNAALTFDVELLRVS